MDLKKKLEQLFDQLLTEVDDETKHQVNAVLSGRDDIILPSYVTSEDEEESEEKIFNIFKLIAELSLPGKMKLAMTGNKASRSALLRDSNRQIPLLVLENPQITEQEIAELVQNTNTDDLVLRTVANNSKWMGNYTIKLAIVSNPKLPLDLSMKWVKFLKNGDLKRLGRSKSIPQSLATQCLKILVLREK